MYREYSPKALGSTPAGAPVYKLPEMPQQGSVYSAKAKRDALAAKMRAKYGNTAPEYERKVVEAHYKYRRVRCKGQRGGNG